MRFLVCVITTLLIAGCGYFDDSDDMANPVIGSTPIVIPVDADWELIATLQRNPLSPAAFYIFPEQIGRGYGFM